MKAVGGSGSAMQGRIWSRDIQTRPIANKGTIIGSLPVQLANFASAQLTAARIAKQTLKPDSFIATLGKEYNRQILQHARRYDSQKSKDKDKEAIPSPSNRKGVKGGARKPRGVWWNCGEARHLKDRFRKPPKSSDGSRRDLKNGTSNGGGRANAVENDMDPESEGI